MALHFRGLSDLASCAVWGQDIAEMRYRRYKARYSLTAFRKCVFQKIDFSVPLPQPILTAEHDGDHLGWVKCALTLPPRP